MYAAHHRPRCGPRTRSQSRSTDAVAGCGPGPGRGPGRGSPSLPTVPRPLFPHPGLRERLSVLEGSDIGGLPPRNEIPQNP